VSVVDAVTNEVDTSVIVSGCVKVVFTTLVVVSVTVNVVGVAVVSVIVT
jgi:hypothetical protein